ncbi:MAG: 6-phospho-3-hexuloisomerase [Planctomycetota bacterium]|jgi:6-phospho-3-hexuloisomerase
MERTIDRILSELTEIAGRTAEEDLARLADRILSADRIYVAGMGRSGLMARAFAMRLMHLGLSVFVAGETTTPSIEEGDLLVCCTRYGRSGTLLHFIDKAHAAGALAAVITMDLDSPMVEKADEVLRISVEGDQATRQPLGTLFEQILLLTLDALVIVLMTKRGFTEREMARLHTNLE